MEVYPFSLSKVRSSLGVVLIGLVLSGCGSRENRWVPTLDGGHYPADNTVDALSPSSHQTAASSTRPSEPGPKASLDQYIVYAALNNPQLRASFEQWKAAMEQVPQATALPDPRLTYRYFIEEVETRVGAQRQSVGLSQTFPWFGKLELRGDAASRQALAAYERYQASKLKLFYEVKFAYYEYYYLGKAIGVVRENLDLVIHLESVARARYRAAAASHPDVVRAQVELGKLSDQLSRLKELRAPLAARFNAAVNRPVDAALEFPEEIHRPRLAESADELLAQAKESNPRLRELKHQVDRSEIEVALACKEYYPDITLGLDYIDTAKSTGGRSPSDDGKDPLIAMVSVNIPLWYEKLDAGVRQARHRHRASLQSRSDYRNRLSSQLKMVLYLLGDAERKATLYHDTLLPKARESLKVNEAAFRAGKAGFLDLIDAQRVLLEFELAYERAVTDYAQRFAETEKLVGRDVAAERARDKQSNLTDGREK